MTVTKNQIVKEAIEILGIDAPSKNIREYVKEKYKVEITDQYICTIQHKLLNNTGEITFSPELLRITRQFVLACGNKQTALDIINKVTTKSKTVQKDTIPVSKITTKSQTVQDNNDSLVNCIEKSTDVLNAISCFF